MNIPLPQAGADLENAVDWSRVEKLLVIRLRSIGDTVLATPTLGALRSHLPKAQIDILLEDWVAPLLDGLDLVDSVISIGPRTGDRLRVASKLRKTGYDAVINLHGGTTSTFLTRATGARYRIGYSDYQYSFLYNLTLGSSSAFWKRDETHSAEQQLALAGFLGVPVADLPEAKLPVSDEAEQAVASRLEVQGADQKRIALIHPVASSFTKQWAPERFGAVSTYLAERGFLSIGVGIPGESETLEAFRGFAPPGTLVFSNLSLPETTSLARRASVFVGNDSGIAHIAAAVGTPPLVIFGSSNRVHWSPWTKGSWKVVFREFDCQPCPGRICGEFGQPRCILEISVDEVTEALDDILTSSNR